MNTRQLQYAIMLAEVRNFSQLAEQLNISQPALSKQIIQLEQELGVRLFDRNTSPLKLTPAGEYFIQEGKELLFKEDQLLRSMERFRKGEEGRLVIGVSPFRSLYLIPELIRQVKVRYPGVQVQLHENHSDQLRKEVAEGCYDFAVVNLPVNESVLEVRPIEQDDMVLAVPNRLLEKVRVQPGQTISLADCREVPFVAMGKSQELRRMLDRLCTKADFNPIIAVEVNGIATAWEMVGAGLGASLVPMQFIKGKYAASDVTLFPVRDSLSTRQPAVVTRRGQYLSEYAKYAIELLTSK